ncbi:MAG: hypothetical protein LKJ25_07570 [Clostridia bacterium]|jgi:hypothetical protein|nr:hypothetical protein [Clostridia bacterium]
MGIALLILKTIGICAAVLAGILVLLLAFIMISRIRYCAKLEKKDQLKAKCDIKWLLGIVKIKINFDENGPEIYVYIFGKKFYPKSSKSKEKEAKKSVSLKKDTRSESLKKFDEEVEAEFKEQDQSIAIASKIPESIKETNKKLSVVKQETKEPIKRKTIKIETTEEPVVKRIKIKEIKEEIKEKTIMPDSEKKDEKPNKEKTDNPKKHEENDIKHYIINMPWEDKKTVMSALIKTLKKTLKTIMPKTIYINGKAGLGSPDYTGILLAFGGILNGMINGECKLDGDFDSMYFYGDIKANGRFTAGYFIITAIRLILIKPVRNLGLYILRN